MFYLGGWDISRAGNVLPRADISLADLVLPRADISLVDHVLPRLDISLGQIHVYSLADHFKGRYTFNCLIMYDLMKMLP